MEVEHIVYYFIIYITGIIIQFSWSQFFTVYGLAPNIIIAFLMYLGLVRGPMVAMIFGFVWGLSWDVLSVDMFGSHALLFTCAGYCFGHLNRKWDEFKVANQMLLTLLASFFVIFGMYALYQAFGSGEYRFKVNYIMLIQPFYTMLIAPLVFWVGRAATSIFNIHFDEYEKD